MKIRHAKERQRSKEYIEQMQYDAEVLLAIEMKAAKLLW